MAAVGVLLFPWAPPGLKIFVDEGDGELEMEEEVVVVTDPSATMK
jgi:hypothetical protein